MNIETANKLVNLRKKNNLSQEELANKLGISRQAISKWERAEAAPDTDNLIKLARLYKISLDDLLLSDLELMKEIDKEIEENFNNNENFEILDDDIKIIKGDKEIYIRSKNRPNQENGKEDKDKIIIIKRTASIIISVLCTIGFFLFAFLTLKWHIAWLFFLGIPLFNSLVLSIYIRKLRFFNYPVLIIIIYFILGFTLDLWAYAWILFLTTPLFYTIANRNKHTIYIKNTH